MLQPTKRTKEKEELWEEKVSLDAEIKYEKFYYIKETQC